LGLYLATGKANCYDAQLVGPLKEPLLDSRRLRHRGLLWLLRTSVKET